MPADVFGGPFGTYVDCTTVCVAAAQLEIGAYHVSLAALYGITLSVAAATAGSYVLVEGASSPSPDFDKIAVEQRHKMGVELSAMWDAIDAAPVV